MNIWTARSIELANDRDYLDQLFPVYPMSKNQEQPISPTTRDEQAGIMFRKWLHSKVIGVPGVSITDFMRNKADCVVLGSSDELLIAAKAWGFSSEGGIKPDFICRFFGNKIMGQVKFLPDLDIYGQRQIGDMMHLINYSGISDVVKLAVIDGAIWSKKSVRATASTTEETEGDEYLRLIRKFDGHNVMSALLLRDFMFHLPKSTAV